MVAEDERGHGLDDGNRAREHAGIMSPPGLVHDIFSRRVERLLSPENRRRRLAIRIYIPFLKMKTLDTPSRIAGSIFLKTDIPLKKLMQDLISSRCDQI